MRPNLITVFLMACLGLPLAGCELIVDFDRSEIPTPAAPDASVGPDAGEPVPDGG